MRSLSTPRRRAIGPLETIEFPASADAPVIVCFHGYGADAADLAPLAAELELPVPARWVFPDAPLLVNHGMGKAWFPIDESRFSGAPIDLSRETPDKMEETARTAAEFLDALAVPRDRVILGGFSQGAMLALELALRGDAIPLGLFLLSGTLVDEQRLRPAAPA